MFDVHRAAYHIILIVNATGCNSVSNLFISEWQSTCFGRSFRPSSEVQDYTYSNRHMPKRYSGLLASGNEMEISSKSFPLASSQQYLFDICLLLYRSADKSLSDQEGNKLGSVSRTRVISTTSRRELPSSLYSCKARRRRKFTPFWQKHYLVSFLVGLRTYQHTCIYSLEPLMMDGKTVRNM